MPPLPHFLVILAALIALPELVLQGADLGLWGSVLWRPLAYQNGAFWAGLLHGWQPNYPSQPWAMFLTYAGLHAGLGHLLGNLLALAWIGPVVLERMGPWRFGVLTLGSAIGGGIAFGLLTSSPAPMVGASGAIFGLVGAWVIQGVRSGRRPKPRAWARALGITLLLVALNAAVWVWEDGLLAWESHLGGFLTGALLALRLGAKTTGAETLNP